MSERNREREHEHEHERGPGAGWPPVFIGMRGAGKTTVGRAWAQLHGTAFVDADAELERRAQRRIAEIFATDGEAAFRASEQPLLLELLARRDCVLATGGGAVLHASVRAALARQAAAGRPVVWLRARAETLAERIAESGRPSLTGAPLAVEVAVVLAEREAHYAALATRVLDTDGVPVHAVLARLCGGDAAAGSREG